MRARYVPLLVVGALVAASAVAAVASPGGTAEPEPSAGWDWEGPGCAYCTRGGPGAYGPFCEVWQGPGGMRQGRGERRQERGAMWQGRGGRFPHGAEAHLLRGDDRLADELKLTGSQREKLREIGEGLARKAIQIRADIQTAHLDLARLLRDDPAGRVRIESQIDAIAKMHGDQMKAVIAARLDARGVLTAEQRKQLEDREPPRRPAR